MPHAEPSPWRARRRGRHRRLACSLTGAFALVACGPPEEPPRVELAVFADPSGLAPVTTDLGYRVELVEARIMVEDLTFAVAGEVHRAWLGERVAALIVRQAHAHPGHFTGGTVTGELRGRYELCWRPDQPGDELGLATLLAGRYESASFTFARAERADGLLPDDPLLGHTARLVGVAHRGGERFDFTAILDAPAGRELVGIPFELRVGAASTDRLGLRLLPEDPHEGDTLFDGVDFAGLPHVAPGTIAIVPGAAEPALIDAYDTLRRTLQTHDHFDVQPSPAG